MASRHDEPRLEGLQPFQPYNQEEYDKIMDDKIIFLFTEFGRDDNNQ